VDKPHAYIVLGFMFLAFIGSLMSRYKDDRWDRMSNLMLGLGTGVAVSEIWFS
jgi:hypothetical protein